ncbi:hypothetical protein VUR80DRAFT_627 [Thermomyces stellatus]
MKLESPRFCKGCEQIPTVGPQNSSIDGSLPVFPPWKTRQSVRSASYSLRAGITHWVSSEIGGQADIVSSSVLEAIDWSNSDSDETLFLPSKTRAVLQPLLTDSLPFGDPVNITGFEIVTTATAARQERGVRCHRSRILTHLLRILRIYMQSPQKEAITCREDAPVPSRRESAPVSWMGGVVLDGVGPL